ncbi:glycosyl hydrolase [Leptospira kmetyi]|uniref:Glycosyl hydrolase n=1 Tax=Leptospira kmetyi TaxID=408139 RepID=A0A2M9XMY6_9LEPT|nr:putative glycoside hydrolase [Leptospira kmetyi]AYV55200.1 glycosyl hydrolase [Leptospira kmetyi]EQA53780.1 glycoside hydrolase domain protein [Leptospira kmetyi serovar Malaysia str. Bejo-Iso9]PJZ40593.1 glycosyl hydrolase [Leptospira kmetyi]TGK17001.1 glycosyl hydrolase [Leptospira kmetyi]TGK32908.1 glycosyl hydrolase [Leptospira kmetyi]
MNKLTFIFFSFLVWTVSLFPDFDLPFPKNRAQKNTAEISFQKVRDVEVGTPEVLTKNVEVASSGKSEFKTPLTQFKTSAPSPKSEPNVTAKIEVVTKQKEENVKRETTSQSVLNVRSPEFSRGIYISQRTLKKIKEFHELRKKSKEHGVNLLVIDVQPTSPSKRVLEDLIAEGFYPVARVVNFDGGLPTEKPSNQRITSIHKSIRAACESGFPEIQLDYIRYADNLQLKLTYETRYKNISGIIKDIRNETLKCDHLPYIGADIFGRIPFNQNDSIGQKVEVFAQVVDVLYPMLYPSHFYGMPARIKDPYQTVYDGTLLTIKRSLKTTRVIPYIQGFNMSVGKSGLTLSNYIKAQVKASYDSGGHGFVVWNAWNDYESTFQALKDYDNETKKD